MAAFTQADLYDKIKELYGISEVTTLMKAQINKYVLERKWSYLDIARALAYFVIEKKGNLAPNSGIGIVPYVMEDSKRYFKQLEETKAQQRAASEDFQKQKSSSYDIKCLHLRKQEKRKRPQIDIGAIGGENKDD